MSIYINSNIVTTSVLRQLSKTTDNLNAATQRESSGLRINSVADDPSGYANSQRITKKANELTTAKTNVSTATDLVSTGETAVSDMLDTLQSLRSLVVEAGDSTLSSTDLASINQQIQVYLDQVNSTVKTTTYGDNTLLNGSFQGVKIQIGSTSSDVMTLSLANCQTSSLGMMARVTGGSVTTLALTAGEVTINGFKVPASSASSDSGSTLYAAASAMSKAAAINSITSQTGVTATSVPATMGGDSAIRAFTLDSSDALTINGVTIPSMSVAAGDSDGALVDAINEQTDSTGVTASLDSSGALVLTAEDGRNIEVQATGDVASNLGLSTTATGSQTFAAMGSIKLTSASAFSVNDPVGAIGLTANQSVGLDAASTLDNMNLSTTSGIADALKTVDAAISQLNSVNSTLGAAYNRMDSLTTTLDDTVTSLKSSASTITDSDYAADTALYTQYQVLQEAQIALLAQANTSAQKAVQLLLE